MAIFRFEAKIFSRRGEGRSVIAAAAYRAGTKLVDEMRDKVFDYLRKARGVVDTAIVAPEGATVLDSGKLWNMVEAGEKRKDAQLAREFVLALPKELPADVQFQVAKDWAQKELAARGMIVELSLHHPRSGKNPHVHMLCTMRKWEGDRFSAKKATEWNDVKLLIGWRKSWADALNVALEQAGRTERVDHRSLKDRGLDQIPQPKIGVAATAMKRKGLVEDPERFKAVRLVKLMNEVRPMVKAIMGRGEVAQHGMGVTWWEKSITFMSRIRQQAAKAVKTGWRRFVEDGRRNDVAKQGHKGPGMTM
jgi:ATP-dependent exoDNAse (exonuclease V) alpha subunit